jgi:hypothetical protein
MAFGWHGVAWRGQQQLSGKDETMTEMERVLYMAQCYRSAVVYALPHLSPHRLFRCWPCSSVLPQSNFPS